MTLAEVAVAYGADATWLLLGWAFAVGAALGSFVGLLVDRLPRHESVIRPRSHCGACQQILTAIDLVPVLSWLALRGRCRRCRAWIGVRPLWVELALGGLSVALMVRLGPSWSLLCAWPVSAALLAIALLDIDWFWVPDALSLPALAWVLLCRCGLGVDAARSALTGLVPAACLWAFAAGYARLCKREGVGLGDVKLLAVIGAATGPLACLLALVLASCLGATVGAVVLALGGHRQAADGQQVPAALADDDWVPPPSAIPFGPFLVLAYYAVVLIPSEWIPWAALASGAWGPGVG